MSTRQIAMEYAPHGIRANVILPGCIETPMTYTTLPPELDRDEGSDERACRRRCCGWASPTRLPTCARSSCQTGASYVTGATITVDGGSTTRSYAFDPIEPETSDEPARCRVSAR